jgi:hypothetical protein
MNSKAFKPAVLSKELYMCKKIEVTGINLRTIDDLLYKHKYIWFESRCLINVIKLLNILAYKRQALLKLKSFS